MLFVSRETKIKEKKRKENSFEIIKIMSKKKFFLFFILLLYLF